MTTVADVKMLKISEIEKKIMVGQGTTLWESWDKMCLAYLVIFKKEGVITKPELQDEYDKWILDNNYEIVCGMQLFEALGKTVKARRVFLLPPEMLIKENYKLYVAKVHNYLVDKLVEKQVPKKEDSSDENSVTLGEKKSKNKNFDFPEDLRWEEIEIRFIGNEDVIIIVRGEHKPTNCLMMGFQNKKTKKPDKQWKFLQMLAIKEGEISWGNNRDLTVKQVDAVKSKKAKIKKRLQNIFGINADPFYSYKKEKAYRIKLKLTPELDVSMDSNPAESSKYDCSSVYDDAIESEFKKKTWSEDVYNGTDDDYD